MRALLLCVLFGISTWVNAQVLPDSISLVDDFLTYKMYQGPMRIGNNRIKWLMQDCDEALKVYSTGKKMESFSAFFAVVGIAGIAASLGDYYFNERDQIPYEIFVPGVVCAGISIPLFRAGTQRSREGIQIYNKDCLN